MIKIFSRRAGTGETGRQLLEGWLRPPPLERGEATRTALEGGRRPGCSTEGQFGFFYSGVGVFNLIRQGEPIISGLC